MGNLQSWQGVNSVQAVVAIVFICFAFLLLVILIITCCVCWCWRYKLHKRKTEIKEKDAELGITTQKTKKPCCRCCGCWFYCCRGCHGCCQPSTKEVHVVPAATTPAPAAVVYPPEAPTAVVNPPAAATTTTTATGGCGCSGGNYGWSKDVYVYSTGPTTQPVNFNNRWSSCNDGRLVLNGSGVVSKLTPGTYGGIYPTMPSGVTASDQFLLRAKH